LSSHIDYQHGDNHNLTGSADLLNAGDSEKYGGGPLDGATGRDQ
jgi:hypothetical protein